MVRHKILLIEDELPIADSVAYSLRNEGFDVQTSGDGLSGLSLYRSFCPDLIILDLMLPKLNGLDFTRIIRKESGVPIIMLTAKTEEIDKVLGLELGADDYIPKPFSMRELIARVRAVLRRVETARKSTDAVAMQCGVIQMDVARRRVTVNDQAVHLPLKQFELLRVLMANKGRVLTREELFRAVWDSEAVYETGTLDVHIRWLRERVEADPSHPQYVRTVRGVGYKISSPDD
jgi:two-component system response regulator RegX3